MAGYLDIAGSDTSGAQSGGPFESDTFFNFAPSTYGAGVGAQTSAPAMANPATASLGGTSPNPNSNTAAVPTQLLGGGSNWIIYVGLAAAAALGIWLITRS
jgi:hypothetical protein